MAEKPDSYDGVYFLPGEEDDELIISYFDFKDDMAGGVPYEGTQIGDIWQVAFFKRDDQGDPVFDDHFEAIFACPATYISNLAGANVYGCMVRKTDKSVKWFEDYLKKVFTNVTIKKLKKYAEAIADS
jgi:hypothetical protein